MDVLVRIKRAVLRGGLVFTAKARFEMDRDALTRDEVKESILEARRIDKTLRSRRRAGGKVARLYVIKSFSYGGTLIYTKGRLAREAGREVFYVLVSAKIATHD
jgi:hypothetical protein